MHIVISGGAGFIGVHSCRAVLARGHRVTVIDDLSRGQPALLPKEAALEVLDVRSPVAYERTHLDGAINAPLTELTEETLPKILPDPDVPVALLCESSMGPTRMIAMTIQAYPVLKANGYKHIYRLNFWKSASPEKIEKSLRFVGTEVKK